MIDIFITDIEEINEAKYRKYFLQLPESMRSKVSKYKFKEDRYRTIAGKMLLLKFLKQNTKFDLSDVKITKYNKPYIKNCNINFNISHSGKYTVCAFSDSNQIGIDIEDVSNEIDLNDFRNFFLEDEFSLIQNSKKQLKKFYTLWTIKEAIVKLKGTGLIDDIKEIIIKKNKVFFKNHEYNISTFKIASYICSVAYTKKDKIKLSTIVI